MFKLLAIRDNRLGGGRTGIIQPVINDLETIYQAEAQSSSHTVGFISRDGEAGWAFCIFTHL